MAVTPNPRMISPNHAGVIEDNMAKPEKYKIEETINTAENDPMRPGYAGIAQVAL